MGLNPEILDNGINVLIDLQVGDIYSWSFANLP